MSGNGGGNPYVTYRTLTKAALLPLTAIALPTIKETAAAAAAISGGVAKRTLSDPQPPRCASVLGAPVSRQWHSIMPSPTIVVVGPGETNNGSPSTTTTISTSPTAGANGRGNVVRPCQRPGAAALPMRSWRSDDSHFTVDRRRRYSTSNDQPVLENGPTTPNQATKVFVHEGPTPTGNTSTTSAIPIIISSPEETTAETADGTPSFGVGGSTNHLQPDGVSPYRRSSCPSPFVVNGRFLTGLGPTIVPAMAMTPDRRRMSTASINSDSVTVTGNGSEWSSRRSSFQRSASTSRKRRRDNWLFAHHNHQHHQQQQVLQQHLFHAPVSSSMTTLSAAAVGVFGTGYTPRMERRRLSVQSALNHCDGIIDEEPEPLTTPSITSGHSESVSVTIEALSSALPSSETRRKSPSSSVFDRLLAGTRMATLDVPDPFTARSTLRATSGGGGGSSGFCGDDEESGRDRSTEDDDCVALNVECSKAAAKRLSTATIDLDSGLSRTSSGSTLSFGVLQ